MMLTRARSALMETDVRTHAAELMLTLVSLAHALIMAGLGAGLIADQLLNRSPQSSSYSVLITVPGFPGSVGTLFLVLAVVQTWLQLIRGRHGLTSIVFALMSSTSAVYAAMYMVGTLHLDSRLFYGPQVTYFGLSIVYGLLSTYYLGRWWLDEQ